MGLSIKLSENGGKAPEAVPYMPAGVSFIHASVNGVPGSRRVVATREACERLQRDLEEHLEASEARQKARPLVMFDHKTDGGAAAVPVGFEWDDERGILLRVEWTKAGREAVEGGNYGYISPSFRLQRGTGEILGLAGGVEVGSLVNDPAFEHNECIAASKEEVPEVVTVYAANPYGCNQYGHEWSGKHGDDWGGTVEEEEDAKEDTLDTLKEKKHKKNIEAQEIEDKLVSLAKKSSNETDLEKRKEINKKIKELAKKRDKIGKEVQELGVKESELRTKERREKEQRGSEQQKTPQERLEESKKAMHDAHANYEKAIKTRSEAMKKVYDLSDDIDRALIKGDTKTVERLEKEQEEARRKWRESEDIVKNATKDYSEVTKKYWDARKKARPQDFVKTAKVDVLPPHKFAENVGGMGENIGVSGEGVGAENRNNNKKNMEEIAKLLGLPADADAATICSKIAAMQKESGEAKKRIEEVEAEKEEHKKALHKHKEEAADAFVKRQKDEGKIAPHDKERLEAARAMYLADSANAELIFAGMRRVDNVREDGKVDTAEQVQAAAQKSYENLSLAELLAAEK